jgi:hypothetical protein
MPDKALCLAPMFSLMASADIDWSLLRVMACSGVPLRQIARRYGLAPGTILSRAKRENWQIRAISKGRNVAAQPIIKKAVEVSNDYIRTNGERCRIALSNCLAKGTTYLQNQPGAEIVENHAAVEGFAKAGDKVFGWSADTPLAVIRIDVLNTPVSALPEKEPREIQAPSLPEQHPGDPG